MLSSRDYHLITEWIEKGISKEQILNGIRNTFQNKELKRVRSLYDCSEYVEIKENKKVLEPIKQVENSPDNNNYLVQILKNFNNLIKDGTNTEILSFYNIYNDKLKYLINSNKVDMFSKINKLEEEFYLKFPDHLGTKDLDSYKTEINKFINSGNNYINEKAKNKALNNHSKNFIINTYLGFNPFEL